MSKQVWKYPLYNYKNYVTMPAGAEILKVGKIDGQISIWVLVNPENNQETRVFNALPTGCDIPQPSTYIDTIIAGTDFPQEAHHLFETTDKEFP